MTLLFTRGRYRSQGIRQEFEGGSSWGRYSKPHNLGETAVKANSDRTVHGILSCVLPVSREELKSLREQGGTLVGAVDGRRNKIL